MAKPTYRLVIKDKDTKANIGVGALWPSASEYNEGGFNLTFETKGRDGTAMNVSMMVNGKRYRTGTDGNCYINVYANRIDPERDGDALDGEGVDGGGLFND